MLLFDDSLSSQYVDSAEAAAAAAQSAALCHVSELHTLCFDVSSEAQRRDTMLLTVPQQAKLLPDGHGDLISCRKPEKCEG